MRRRRATILLGATLVAFFAGAQSTAPPVLGPTVGDPVAIEVDLEPGEVVTLGPVEGVEMIEQSPDRVLVRSFRPGTIRVPLVVTGNDAQTRELVTEIQVASVLRGEDDLEPSPLAPPIPPPPNRVAWVAIAIASAAAVFVWLGLLRRPEPLPGTSRVSLSASEELLRAIARVRQMSPSDERFATLSDATRRFLSRVDPDLDRALTTRELIERLRGRFPEWLIEDVSDVLSEGDYAKFSPWGGRSGRFETIVKEANDLAVIDRRPGAA